MKVRVIRIHGIVCCREYACGFVIVAHKLSGGSSSRIRLDCCNLAWRIEADWFELVCEQTPLDEVGP